MPLLWATSSGADVMKRIAAPMVGGLFTSAILTLEIIPVVSTYWRREQLLWERLASLDPGSLGALQRWTYLLGAGAAVVLAAAVVPVYLEASGLVLGVTAAFGAALFLIGTVVYLARRRVASEQVWPARA